VPTVAYTAAIRPSDGKPINLVKSMPSLAEIAVPRPVPRRVAENIMHNLGFYILHSRMSMVCLSGKSVNRCHPVFEEHPLKIGVEAL